jgi:hypothetical protein
VLLAGAARAGVVAANFRHGADEWSPTRCSMRMAMRMAVMMMAMVVPMIMRMIVAATAGVIDGGFEGFARQFESLGGNGLGIS